MDSAYFEQLSDASRLSLKLQGGPLDESGVERFRSNPFFEAAVRLRGYDEQAKQVGLKTPPLSHFMDIVACVLS